jgi:hypothetical protein
MEKWRFSREPQELWLQHYLVTSAHLRIYRYIQVTQIHSREHICIASFARSENFSAPPRWSDYRHTRFYLVHVHFTNLLSH